MRNNVAKDSKTGTAHCTCDVLKLVPATFVYSLWMSKSDNEPFPVSFDYLKMLAECPIKPYDSSEQKELGILFSSISDTGQETPVQIMSTFLSTSTHTLSSILRECCIEFAKKLSITHAFMIPSPLVQSIGRIYCVGRDGLIHMTDSFDMKTLSFFPGELIKNISYTSIQKRLIIQYLKNVSILTNKTEARTVIRNIKGGYVDVDGSVTKISKRATGMDINEVLGLAKERLVGVKDDSEEFAAPKKSFKLMFTYVKGSKYK
jgi:hypothetical protein